MTAWHRERWRKLYLREPLEQEALPWYVRGLRDLLIRRAEDDGFLARSGDALQAALRGDDLFREAVDTLVDDGFLAERDDGSLFVRNLPVAQGDDDEDPEPAVPENETPLERRRRLARVRAKAARVRAKGTVASRTERDGERDDVRTVVRTQSVTERDASHPPLSPSHSPSPLPDSQNIQPNQTNERSGTHAHVRDGAYAERDGARTPSVTPSVTERDAMPCPFDLVERAQTAGLIASLAKRLRARERDVLAVAAEFVEYWIVARGGQPQRNWLGKLRDWVERKHRAGELSGAAGPEENQEDRAATEPVKLHPRAAARIARQQAEAEAKQRELIAEFEASGKKLPVRNVDALAAWIGGQD